MLGTACGGGGGGGAPGIAPTAAIRFPPGPSLTSEAEITIRGIAADPDGVAQVTVNGVAASTTDGFASWTAVVPLSLGDNAIVVETQDTGGAVDAAAAQVAVRREGPVPASAVAAAYAPGNGRVLLADTKVGLMAVTLATGTRALISSDERGVGESPFGFNGSYGFEAIVVRPANNRLYVALDGSSTRIAEVDPTTGDRTLVSSTARGAGPNLPNTVYSLAIDAPAAELYIGDNSGEVQRIDIATGDRTEIVPAAGVGTSISRAEDMAVDILSGDLYVLDSISQAIVSVDLTTLVRAEVSGSSVGAGPGFGSFPDYLALDALGGRAFVLRNTELFEVNLGTGDRTLISGLSVGTGPELEEYCDLAWDVAGSRLLVVRETGGLLAVDPTTGNRTLLHEPGFGPAASRVYEDVALSPAGDAVLYFDSRATPGTLFELDLVTGAERVVADVVTGAGPSVNEGMRIAHDAVAGAAFLLDSDAVLRVDLATGNRIVVSDAGTGAGPALSSPIDLALGAIPGSVVVAESSAGLLQVTVASGDRVSLADVASLGGSVSTCDVAADPFGGRVFLSNDDGGDRVYAVDVPPSGVTTLVGVGPGATGLLDDDLDDATFDGLTGDVFVLLESFGLLAQLDPDTDVAAVFAGTTDGKGPLLLPRRIDGSPSLGFVVLSADGGLVAIDTVTGERVLLTLVGNRRSGNR